MGKIENRWLTGGILLFVFKKEILAQCGHAFLGYQDLEQAVAVLKAHLKGGPVAEGVNARIWYSINSFLIAVGNIPKLLWGSKGTQFPELRDRLRIDLGIEDTSPLRLRNFRNDFEHIDERLERYAASPQRRKEFVDGGTIGRPCDSHPFAEGDWFRHFDHQAMILYVWEQKYELSPIIEAIKQLADRAYSEIMKCMTWRACPLLEWAEKEFG